MVTILSAVVSIFAFRFRSRASLELKLIALQHQLAVLRRQRPGRPQLSSLDRLLWVWLYRIWPQVIDAMILVKPATVVQWHRKGFRLHWAGDHAVRSRGYALYRSGLSGRGLGTGRPTPWRRESRLLCCAFSRRRTGTVTGRWREWLTGMRCGAQVTAQNRGESSFSGATVARKKA
jgi:hypothetical protein